MKRWLLLILVAGLLLRLPGLAWDVRPGGQFDEFQPDESQHVGIAMQLLTQVVPGLELEKRYTDEWNAPAMGAHIALVGYLPTMLGASHVWLYMIARVVSLLYGLATVILVYLMARRLLRSETAALVSAAFMAVFDLHATYSHMGVPEVVYVFWSYAATYWLAQLFDEPERTDRWLWLLAGVAAASALALTLRFHVVVPAIVVTTMLLAPRLRSAVTLALFALLVAGAFYISVGFDYSVADGIESLRVLTRQNRDVIPQDNHLLWNPLLYGVAVVAGTSIPAAILAVIGGVRVARQPGPERRLVVLLVALLGLTFLLFYVGDGTFVRRATIFLPFAAVLTGYAFSWLRGRFTERAVLVLVGLALAYTAALAVHSQYRFVDDTRYRAADYLQEHHIDADIAYTFYARTEGMPEGVNLIQAEELPDVLVLHEARYARYWKFFTTPFGVPECCSEVYHCNYNECALVQRLFRGETDYELVRSFRYREVFPERILFRRWFGTYEDLLGSVLIYERM